MHKTWLAGMMHISTVLAREGAHHHANVCFVLLIHSIVQDNVHELIKATQHASNVPVGIQGHCRTLHTIKGGTPETHDTTA